MTNAERCAIVHARYDELLRLRLGLPAGGSASEGGRSLSSSPADLEKEIEVMVREANDLGCPIHAAGIPAVIISRARA